MGRPFRTARPPSSFSFRPALGTAGAVLLSGINKLVIGAEDAKQGACGSVVDLPGNERLNRKLTVVKGVLAGECASLLRKAPVSTRT